MRATPQPPAPSGLLPVSADLPALWTSHTNGVSPYTACGDWLVSLSPIASGLTHVVMYRFFILLRYQTTIHSVNIPPFIYPFIS